MGENDQALRTRFEADATAQQIDEVASRLIETPGVGPLMASAFAASVEGAGAFKNARRFASWLGFTPRQNSSGGKEKLLAILKRGDVYLRPLLIHGERSLLRSNASCSPALRA
ncbi:transposase [Stappia sp. GBMRC 2046]|uniref:Transposase n=1 Tax=Stappia sediminis TaxID=2692190 RepID=A0A7X3LUL6_9HYPH|nr:transposase [Stappia sediminis]MXN65420.1 transposase [Stappia sediminis]